MEWIKWREWGQTAKVQILALPSTSCVILSKLLNVSVPYRICCEDLILSA